MVRRSNKSIAEILTTTTITKDNKDLEVQRKIILATESFISTNKFCELILRDRNRISSENALAVSNYIIAMKGRLILGPTL
jgi:hypothetical protein